MEEIKNATTPEKWLRPLVGRHQRQKLSALNWKNVAFYGVCMGRRPWSPLLANSCQKHFIQLEFRYSMHMASNIPELISMLLFERGCFSRQSIAFYAVCIWVDNHHCQHLPAVASKRSQEHFVQLAFCYPMNMNPKSLEMPSRPGLEGSTTRVTLKVFFEWWNPNNTLT